MYYLYPLLWNYPILSNSIQYYPLLSIIIPYSPIIHYYPVLSIMIIQDYPSLSFA